MPGRKFLVVRLLSQFLSVNTYVVGTCLWKLLIFLTTSHFQSLSPKLALYALVLISKVINRIVTGAVLPNKMCNYFYAAFIDKDTWNENVRNPLFLFYIFYYLFNLELIKVLGCLNVLWCYFFLPLYNFVLVFIFILRSYFIFQLSYHHSLARFISKNTACCYVILFVYVFLIFYSLL